MAEDIDGRNMPNWEPLVQVIEDHFHRVNIPITEVMYW